MNDREVLEALYATVENRRDNPKEGSYTVSYTHLTLPTT